jgi:hypothetical protein
MWEVTLVLTIMTTLELYEGYGLTRKPAIPFRC